MSKRKRDKPQDNALEQAESRIETDRRGIRPIGEVSESRRSFTKAAILAPPILMSVASRPVFGGGIPCISNMLSGNLSHPQRGQCLFGMSPDYWRNTDPADWPLSGDTTFDDIFGDGDIRTIVEIFEDDIESEKSAFVTAYMNALSTDYILKPMQVQDLWADLYVHVFDRKAFLQRTWGEGERPWDGTW